MRDVAGVLRGPETLYDNVTRVAASIVVRALPASNGEVQDNKAEFEAYKAMTAALRLAASRCGRAQRCVWEVQE